MNKFEEFRTALIKAGFEDDTRTTYCIFDGDDTPEYEGGWREAGEKFEEVSSKYNYRHVESEGGQDADEFADFASRQTFPDGTNMLAMMHNDNYIKKFKTNEIMVTFGNTADGRILLNKLNEMVAKEKGMSVKDMAKDPDAPAEAPAKKTTKKADAKKTTAKE